MHYEEKTINNILMYRTSPSDEFQQVSPESMTLMIQDLRSQLSGKEYGVYE